MNQEFVFMKVRDVKSPTRGTSKASGIDFYVPYFNISMIKAIREKNPDISTLRPGCFEYIIDSINIMGMSRILLAPGARIIIPSGIKARGMEGLSLNAHNKSGVSTKKGLIYGAEVVDQDYTGEIHISIINTSNFIVEIKEGEKILQFLQEPVNIGTIKEVFSSEELFIDEESERGDNWQGSTNKL